MEPKPAQPPVQEAPQTLEPKKFPWERLLLIILALIVLLGGTGFVLAWRTDLLDPWLSPNIKELFGRPEQAEVTKEPTDGTEEETEEESEEPEEEPDETADWKTYTNSTYSYSIKYPPSLVYLESSKGPGQVIFDTSLEEAQTPEGLAGKPILISVRTSIPDPLITREIYGQPQEVEEERTLEIGGELGEQVVFAKSPGGLKAQSAVVFEGKAYYFNLHIHPDNFREEYDLMLSTFKFLEP